MKERQGPRGQGFEGSRESATDEKKDVSVLCSFRVVLSLTLDPLTPGTLEPFIVRRTL
jgi:hypothetical protein